MIAWLLISGCAFFGAAFIFYGRFLDRRMGINPDRITPAVEENDHVDFVPTADPVLFGHHFSSIAGAGPIVGPIIAGLAFGWLPALLWIVLGATLIGGVHDYSALVASLRHKGRSIGEIARNYLNAPTYYIFLIFIWFTLVYVLIVFLDLVATGFAPALPAMQTYGGEVATASMLYILIALAFGFSMYRLKVRVLTASLIFVPMVFLGLWVGHLFPLSADHLPALFGSTRNTWYVALLVYCFIASITPVWILLQPRDFLSSFLLYACLLLGAAGLVIGGLRGEIVVAYPAFLGLTDRHLGFIFPALFITVACGAVSGFHSLVASGTTSKQLRRESSARTIAYGGMLVEGILAMVALGAIMILHTRPENRSPLAVFAQGIGAFLAAVGVNRSVATSFGLLAVSTFLLTTLDTCTRLARFIFQEITGMWNAAGRVLGTIVTLALPSYIVFQKIPGPGGKLIPAWKAIWPVFGTTNQLMAALALLVVYTWMRRTGRRAVFILLPMLFMAVTTLTSLTQLTWRNIILSGSRLVGTFSALLLAMALVVIFETARRLLSTKTLRPEEAS